MSRFNKIGSLTKKVIFVSLLIAIAMVPHRAFLLIPPADMADYTAYPPFITESAPPLVMLAMGRDHKVYYEAYNDASDIDEDGRLDVGYKHSVDYYGYFDPYKCYSYSGSGATAKFNPVSTTSNKYCSGAWSGNFLNWLSMSRMDVIKKVFYGGYRSTDSSAETVLEGVYIPQDAHSWGKEYAGSDTDQLTPLSDPVSGTRHLFCVTSLSDGDPHLIRVLQNRTERIWQWASIERPVCQNSIDSNNNGKARFSVGGADSSDPDLSGSISNYNVRVRVCDPSVGLESNCKSYPGSGGLYKPVGLLQKYGEGDGSGSKVCSKTYTKACNTDADCNPSTEGICIDKAQMYFGLMTGTYTKNLTGGVLRKNVWSMLDETNANTGIFQTSENVEGNIVITLDRMKTIGFRYSDYSYQEPSGGNCGWITTRPINEGECRMWGNPMAEIMYEATRYFADKGSPTTDFTYSGVQDSGLNLTKPSWIRPYDIYPSCSKPFILTFSDINPSYDSDKVPGSSFGSFSGDLPGLDVSTLSNTIGTSEGIAGTERFIGQSGIYDFICSKKYVSNLSSIRGLCPEEPTKQGSYYSAAVAYYGKTLLKSETGKENINTYTVALSSPVPDVNIKVGDSKVRLVPTGKSVSGCLGNYGACAQKCTLTYGSNGLLISNCSMDSYCSTNQIVDFYVDTITYDANNNITYAKFRINFEDVEQGADHDMDVIAIYEIQPVGDNQVQVTLTSQYAAGCIDQVLGFTISGTTEDGLYLPVRDADSGSDDGDTDPPVNTMPLTWTKTFTASGTAAGALKDPFWYAAKWGGFEDRNDSGTPDNVGEWDSDNNGIPDTYYLVVNPLKLERQLTEAFESMKMRAASGTAVSVLATTGEGEGAVYQAYFYPKKLEGNEERKWLGYIHGLFLDPCGNLREDTNMNNTLDGIPTTCGTVPATCGSRDYVVKTRYDQSNGTLIDRFDDANCNGNPDDGTNPFTGQPDFSYIDTIKLENVHSLWNGGKRLWDKLPSDRKIYTTTDGYNLINFTDSAKSALRQYLRAVDDTEAENIINYIRGQDVTGYRKRTITIDGQTKVWKLGDIVYSTPAAVSKPMENYDLIYGDVDYSTFRQRYLNRRHVVYVGANDGMLHAFNGGVYDISTHRFSGSGHELGDELWAFIPREVLPHLKWLTDPNYTHVYYVDLKPKVTDVRIFSNDTTHPGGWGTILIGGMRYGGKSIPTEIGNFRSTYFAIDITDPDATDGSYGKLLWTFDTTDSGVTDLGLTLSYPAVAKTGSGASERWYVIFGSGPTNFDSLSNLTGFQNGNVFVLDITAGVIPAWTLNSNYWKIQTGHSNSFMANPITIDVNTDFTVDAAYIGENYTQSGNRRAVMWRLNTNVTPWSLSALYNVNSADDISKRITAAPSAALDRRGNLWIYFGTGQFIGVADRNQSDTGAFYAIKDGCWNGSCSTTYSDLLDVTNAVVNFGGGTVTGVTGASDWAQLLSTVATKEGWVIYFKNMTVETTDFLGNTLQHQGERVTTKPAILGGLVMFATYIPGGDICVTEGKSNLYALYYETGTSYRTYVFRREKEIKGESPSQTVSRTAYLGKGLPASVALAVTREGKLKGFVQSSTGDILPIHEIDPNAPRSKYIGWKAGGL
ncbi:MAG: PilC/PilY family type IV pilus protein [Nitrospirota bacterium]